MPESPVSELSQFAMDVAEGLGSSTQKRLSPRYFYDELGSSLFEAITLLPEYGLTRADERLLRAYAGDIAKGMRGARVVAELGSGSGRKTRHILSAVSGTDDVYYLPIDISRAALSACERELSDLASVQVICADWLEGLDEIAKQRSDESPMLLLFLGSSLGNVQRDQMIPFLGEVRNRLRPGDFFLLGADLVKDVEIMLAAYDDPTGVTAAFNLNLLGRINRELGAGFELRSFAHDVRWNSRDRCIEMHLLSRCDQEVYIEALNTRILFAAGETIWTESSHKFTQAELDTYAHSSGFCPVQTWTDGEWPFAEALWIADGRPGGYRSP